MAKTANGWTLDKIKELQAKGTIKGYVVKGEKPEQTKKESKYKNKKTEVDGIVFASIREAKRYKALLLLRKAGHIGQLRLQVPYELNEGGTHSLKYIADFVYMDAKTGETIVEDSKGARTATYRKKRRLMKAIHGIEILET